ncbi:hypothetical protein SDIAM103S_04621 [Streptomyces diastaticus subsp. diastaticus]
MPPPGPARCPAPALAGRASQDTAVRRPGRACPRALGTGGPDGRPRSRTAVPAGSAGRPPAQPDGGAGGQRRTAARAAGRRCRRAAPPRHRAVRGERRLGAGGKGYGVRAEVDERGARRRGGGGREGPRGRRTVPGGRRRDRRGGASTVRWEDPRGGGAASCPWAVRAAPRGCGSQGVRWRTPACGASAVPGGWAGQPSPPGPAAPDRACIRSSMYSHGIRRPGQARRPVLVEAGGAGRGEVEQGGGTGGAGSAGVPNRSGRSRSRPRRDRGG